AIGYYTADNAVEWLDIDKFMGWLSRSIQRSADSMPPTPLGPVSLPLCPDPSLATPSSPSTVPPSSSVPNARPNTSRDRTEISDDDDPPPTPLISQVKRRRALSKAQSLSSESDSDAPEGDFAYLLDLSDDTREWVDKNGDLLSMVAIIKSEDQDAWGEGTGGSVSKPTKVAALDGAPCQVATHRCQGVYICSQLDTSLLEGHERYEPDDEAMRDLFEADRVVNVRDTSSMSLVVAAFYNDVYTKKCPFIDASGNQCQGGPVYRKLRQMNFDGKYGFIGCQNYSAGGKHRFVSINRDVDEDLLRELFQNNGRFTSFVNVVSTNCARVLPPRQGGKGNRKCPYTHVDQNGLILPGNIVRRPCNTWIKIFAPIDRNGRRAIIYLSKPHNHPRPPCTKLSRDGKDAYKQAILAAGATNLTVLKYDNGSYTSKIFNGNIPASLDPALLNPRIKRKLIYDLKTTENPHGLSWEGVCFFQEKMRETLPPEKRYIQYLTSDDGVQIVLTMLPFLAGRIHAAKASLHDNMYARLHGVWKEWEVVIWDDKLNCRVTITRIYSKRETEEVFAKMWPALWDTIERVTGVQVKFKFIHGEGLQAVLVDGNKLQVNTFGADLVKRNNPYLSGIHETEPTKIVGFTLRTCRLHVDRKFTKMGLVVPDEEMGRIRGCYFIKTQSELDEFIEWCKNSEYKIIRDWIKDKESAPWFFPSINQFLSKISEEDWILTPGDTNLNESAHPYTNQHTGTNLPLLIAIQTAYKLDLEVEAKIQLMEKNCVLVNHNNSKSTQDRRNAARRALHYQQALDRKEAQTELEEIDTALEQQAEARKTSNQITKDLRDKKKALQTASGVKKTKRQGEKERARLPDENEMAGTTESGV
ncbi:hypothetical protein B0H16DRAFT_1265082, partial [Mycena metata]